MIQRLYSARTRMLFLHFAPALFLVVILAALPAAAASITNGDFEAVQIGSPFFSTNPSDIPGWTHSGDVGDALLWAVGYSDPFGSVTVAGSLNQFVTLGGGFDDVGTGSWSAIITGLTAGDSYLLDFMMADESTLSSNQQITVGFSDGSSTLPVTFTTTGAPSANYWTDWQNEEETFVANDASATVLFTAKTPFDVGLDDVRVREAVVPEPSFPALLTCALLMVSGFRSRVACVRRPKARGPSA